MSLFLTKECGQSTVQEERGTDDRGSLAMFTAIRLALSRSNNFAADLRPRSSSK
jgi:hypothetical protein